MPGNQCFYIVIWLGMEFFFMLTMLKMKKYLHWPSILINIEQSLLYVPLNYWDDLTFPTHYLYGDVGGVIISIYTFNLQLCGTWRLKMCSLKKPGENHDVREGNYNQSACPWLVTFRQGWLTYHFIAMVHLE